MSAREIIADGIVKETGVSLATIRADAAISALTAAGYRIVGPGEVDGETLERAAKVVEDGRETTLVYDNWSATEVEDWKDMAALAAAIRALATHPRNKESSQ